VIHKTETLFVLGSSFYHAAIDLRGLNVCVCIERVGREVMQERSPKGA